jgi:sec-independent protein translocase protein TatA
MGFESLIVVVLAAGMLLFGSKKLPDLFRSLGRAKSEYEKAKLKLNENSEGFKALWMEVILEGKA